MAEEAGKARGQRPRRDSAPRITRTAFCGAPAAPHVGQGRGRGGGSQWAAAGADSARHVNNRNAPN